MTNAFDVVTAATKATSTTRRRAIVIIFDVEFVQNVSTGWRSDTSQEKEKGRKGCRYDTLLANYEVNPADFTVAVNTP
jgi:hypothetical protein